MFEPASLSSGDLQPSFLSKICGDCFKEIGILGPLLNFL